MKYRTLCLSLLLLTSPLSNVSCIESQINLKTADIKQIMQQMLSQHVGKKQVDPTVLKAALKSYIEQFDPFRIYLLESEAQPYLNISDIQAQRLYQQFLQNDFSEFIKLNTLIQKAISRARQFRKELGSKEEATLFSPNQSLKEDWRNTGPLHPFAINPEELKARVKFDIIQYIISQKKRFGNDSVIRNQKHTLVMYANDMEENENEYMTANEHGVAYPATYPESMLSMHILKAIASNFDAHTKFFNPQEAYNMKVRLEKGFQGVGLELQERPEGIVVSGFVKEGPAEKNGKINIGDVLITINNKTIDEESFDEVLTLLRGPNGSTVSLQLEHPSRFGSGDKYSVLLQRAPIAVYEGRVDTSYEKIDNGIIGRIALHSFYQGDNNITSESDVHAAIQKLQKVGKLRGLILDLRDNMGGFLMQAVKVAGLFITKGVIVISKYSNGDEHFYRDTDDKRDYDGPLIVLTSKETASAAEIVAQALQDYGVALVVGDDRTFGKGTIQSQTVTGSNASSLFKVTVGTYYTVSGKSPQNKGVKADVIVPSPLSQEEIGERYLTDTVEASNISPSFNDSLADIDPSMKAWYQRHYVPSIQTKKQNWLDMLPTLRRNSEKRMGDNETAYAGFLRKNFGNIPNAKHTSNDPIDDLTKLSKKDLQLNEAVHILKDMVQLQSNVIAN